MEKKQRVRWKNNSPPATLRLLCFGMLVSPAFSQMNEQHSSQNAEQALRQAREKNAELSAKLAQVQRDLENLRERYSDLYLRAQVTQQTQEQLNLYIANLIEGDLGDDGSANERRLLGLFRHQQKCIADLSEKVNIFGEYLIVALDIINPSEVMCRELYSRFEALKRRVDSLAQPTPTVARRGVIELKARACRVLAVNDQLQTVILSAGELDGVGLGMVWHITDADAKKIKFRIVEVRSRISAAMIIMGSADDVAPGMTAEPGQGLQ